MKTTSKILVALMATFIMAIPAVMCTGTQIPYPLSGVIDSTGYSIKSPVSVAPQHVDASDLTYGKSCKRQFAEKALQRDFWGMVRVGLFCPSTVYSY